MVGFGGFCRVQGFSGLMVHRKCLVDRDFVVEDGSHEEVSGSGGDGLVLNFQSFKGFWFGVKEVYVCMD